ncbi:hypothetical protein AX16_001979 [Volvariella volvacea WC 439]|nr:hypothetical protein AX16_001979 [Volvariella volvacea WC 439]
MSAIHQFDKVYSGDPPEVGRLRVAASGVAWKAANSEKATYLKSSDILWAQWLHIARDFQLRIGLRNHNKERFDGFTGEDEIGEPLISKVCNISNPSNQLPTTRVLGEDLLFLVSGKVAFELPLRHVASCYISGRTEVSLEFSNQPNPGTDKLAGDELTEVRFYVPGTVENSNAGTHQSDEEEESSAAQVFCDTVKDKAKIGYSQSDLVLSFEKVLILNLRGRYNLDIFPTFVRLRGKTYDYRIAFQNIKKLFLLPKDDQQVLFILGLGTPIRQGQTYYWYLVMQFSREEGITAKLNLKVEEIKTYDKLQESYEAPTYEAVSSIFRALSRKKIIDSGSFNSRSGHPRFKANLKAIQGDLFVLEKYIFFVYKQPLLIDLNDIHQAIFSRVGSGVATTAGRTFDLKIVIKSGPEYGFTSINREEHQLIEAYLENKSIQVKNEAHSDFDPPFVDDEDEGMQKRASRENTKVRGEDNASSEDDDFRASDSDSGSPSDSNSSGAEIASDASGDLTFMESSNAQPKANRKRKGKKTAPSSKRAAGTEVGQRKVDEKQKFVAAIQGSSLKAKQREATDVNRENRPRPKAKKRENNEDVDRPKKKVKLVKSPA